MFKIVYYSQFKKSLRFLWKQRIIDYFIIYHIIANPLIWTKYSSTDPQTEPDLYITTLECCCWLPMMFQRRSRLAKLIITTDIPKWISNKEAPEICISASISLPKNSVQAHQTATSESIQLKKQRFTNSITIYRIR